MFSHGSLRYTRAIRSFLIWSFSRNLLKKFSEGIIRHPLAFFEHEHRFLPGKEPRGGPINQLQGWPDFLRLYDLTVTWLDDVDDKK